MTLTHHKPTLELSTKNRPHLIQLGDRRTGSPNRDRSRNETLRPSAHELPGYTELASGVDARHHKKRWYQPPYGRSRSFDVRTLQ
jgi:hypothetical protein